MQQIQGKTWNKELHREMDSITRGAAPFKTIHVHYIHQSTRTSDMMQRTSTMATVSYRCQAIDKQNCSFYSLHRPSAGFPCLLSSAFDSPSFSMHANISTHKLIYLATKALSDSFWIYRRYINKSIYLSIYACGARNLLKCISDAATECRRSAWHFSSSSGLTPQIPSTVYQYFWAYPFLLCSFFHFLVVVVDWADLYQLLSVR